jgi:hypothetical protein
VQTPGDTRLKRSITSCFRCAMNSLGKLAGEPIYHARETVVCIQIQRNHPVACRLALGYEHARLVLGNIS